MNISTLILDTYFLEKPVFEGKGRLVGSWFICGSCHRKFRYYELEKHLTNAHKEILFSEAL